MKLMDKEKQLATWLMAHTEIEMAILFGSYAQGTATIHSDIDLAIQLSSGKTIHAEDKINYVIQLGQLLETDIDLVDLKKAGQPLLSQIIKYGKRLKGQQINYIELALKNINTTQDFMPYIERMMLTRRERWLANG
ncbi:MAG: nucleotidyltransferase domain-containing protein [Methylobacter sp.]|nr:nucleotidyltransferase domain-containing protein [Methylobacter sp.]MDP2100520.1 nucleotidyltransferase domain-containing protein [Methylobacter sp.]MDP2428727.1 nucleotidyltransferase domain-containing protein [Methylobacter sp.]MDP3053257.1 nucleotidyltransferase domain-containing protein [Methylobacter sp.]MDP3361544.1 nucleotidyltransferase domain-containing protein [Methylobacter sp.]